MSSTIRIRPERLNTAGSEFRTASSEILEVLSGLDTTASNLSSSWTGKSHASFENLWARWHNSIYDLSQAMETIAETLEKASHAYTQTDENAMPHVQ